MNRLSGLDVRSANSINNLCTLKLPDTWTLLIIKDVQSTLVF